MHIPSSFQRWVHALGIVMFSTFVHGAPAEERLDIAYYQPSQGDDAYAKQQCKLDVYLPAPPARDFPILVWFHGGGLTGGDKTARAEQVAARRLAAQGVAVVSANYRHSPDVRFPVYVEDCARAVRWAVDHAGQLGADETKIHVGGYSAGGYISALLALDERFLRATGVYDKVAGFVCMSGQMTTHFTVRDETGLPRDTVVANDAAPLAHVRTGVPRILLLCGDDDFPARLEENQFLAAALHHVAKNPPVPLVVVKDRNHGAMLSRFLEGDDPAGIAVLDFVRR